jgi:tRNA threonylcarbamoyladenosine biosynthesis protein TsaE
MHTQEITITNLDELRSFAERLVGVFHGGDHATVIGFRGDLGAGKTTTTQMIAKQIGVTETITSPTFVIMKIYEANHPYFSQLVHIDAYRLEQENDTKTLGLADIMHDPYNLVIIEWPEKMNDSILDDAVFVDFEFINETTRIIRLPASLGVE